MTLKMPTFSIIVPTFNRASTIARLLESLINITYPRDLYEIIVVNDGSTDNTIDVLNRFSNNIKIYTIDNSERGYARNYGASKSKYKYINFFDSDDICLANHLLSAASSIVTYNFPEVIAQGYQLRKENGEVIYTSKWKLYETLNQHLYNNIIGCDGVFIREDIAKEYKFTEDRNISGSEDWYLWFELAHKFPIYASPSISHYGIEHSGRSIYQTKSSFMHNKFRILISLISSFKGYNKNIDLRSKAISYLKLELSQYLTSDSSFRSKLNGILTSSIAFFSNPLVRFLKLYLLSFSNSFGFTKSR